jgi:hypothetical protein
LRFRIGLLITLAACRLRFDPVTGEDDGGAMDSITADGHSPMGCNAVTRLSDDFEDGVFDEHLWDSTFSDPGTSYAEMGGDLVLTLASNSSSTFVGYKSSVAMDIREQRIVAAISGFPAVNANMGLRVESNFAQDAVVIGTEGNTLYARKTVGGAFSVLNTIPFDTAMHRFWALSEHAGTLTWEWSQDGTSFNTLYSAPDPIDLSFKYVQVFAGTQNAIASPGTARYASFNAGVPALSTACAPSAFMDTFDDGVTGEEWRVFLDSCCSDAETGGHLVVSSNGTAMGTKSRRSGWGFDLRGASIGITVVEIPTNANQTGIFAAYYDAQNQLQIRVSSSAITVRIVIGGTPTNTNYALPGPAPFHVRIREAGGMVFFEATTNKQVGWSVMQMQPAPFSVDDVRISIALNAASLAADHITFDDLDVP